MYWVHMQKGMQKKIWVWVSCLLLVSTSPKSGFFLQNLLQSKFWNRFKAEVIPWSPILLHFLTAFCMVSKNQESCESWLVRFWVSRPSNTSKISVNQFFIIIIIIIIISYLSCYGFTDYFEILSFCFSNIIPEEVSTC